jgi:hypothetical protein
MKAELSMQVFERARHQVTGDSSAAGAARVTMQELLQDAIKQVGGLPLTIIVHDWDSMSAKEFISALRPHLRKMDSFILVPAFASETPLSPSELSRVVILNLRKNSHRWTYNNSIGDIVFFPGMDQEELSTVVSFQRRAHVMVVDGRGRVAAEVKQLACETSKSTYLWSGEMMLDKCNQSNGSTPNIAQRAEQSLDSIGKHLAEVAVHLTKATVHLTKAVVHLEQLGNETTSPVVPVPRAQPIYPREFFKSAIHQVAESYSDRHGLARDLVFQADKYSWPDWSVQCLPELYIPLDSHPGDHKRALVWRWILDCVPLHYYSVVKTLCGDQFSEVRMSVDNDLIIRDVAKIFAETVQQDDCRTDSAFYGEVNEALIRVDSELALSIREPHQMVLKKMAVGAS